MTDQIDKVVRELNTISKEMTAIRRALEKEVGITDKNNILLTNINKTLDKLEIDTQGRIDNLRGSVGRINDTLDRNHIR